MATASGRGVLVGYDGSPGSVAALDWACQEARLRDLPVHVIHAFGISNVVAASLIATTEPAEVVDEVLQTALERARRLFPGLRVTVEATAGYAAATLVEQSADADLVVVGTRGRGGVAGSILGSVSLQVATHARCRAAVVVPEPAATSTARAVVVGFDGSACSQAALGYAFDAAARSGADLHVLSAWWVEFMDGVVVTTPGSLPWRRLERTKRAAMEQAMASWVVTHPDVVVECHVVRASPADALVRAGHNAEQLVVGSRGRGGFRELLLGSVSLEVVQHAPCPVAVVHR